MCVHSHKHSESCLCVCALTNTHQLFMCVCVLTQALVSLCVRTHTSTCQKTAFNVSSLSTFLWVPDVRLSSRSFFSASHVTDPCIPLFPDFSLWSGLGRERAGPNLTFLNCWNCLRKIALSHSGFWGAHYVVQSGTWGPMAE